MSVKPNKCFKPKKCLTCGYYEDSIAWHYEDCPKLKENEVKNETKT